MFEELCAIQNVLIDDCPMKICCALRRSLAPTVKISFNEILVTSLSPIKSLPSPYARGPVCTMLTERLASRISTFGRSMPPTPSSFILGVGRFTPRDFDNPKFGRSPDHPEYVGRKVDCVGRSLRVARTADRIAALRAYLGNAKGGSPAELAKKGVVLIEPAHLRGTVVWPLG